MAFPIIYDIIAVTAHYVVTFTPKASSQDNVLKSGAYGHKDFYQLYEYDNSLRQDSLVDGDWNAWTIWNSA